MRRRRTLALDAAIAVGIACSVLAITAIANSAQNSYPTRWMRDKSVEYRVDGSVPADFRGRVVHAAKQWSKLNASLSFKRESGKAHIYPQSKCGSHYQDNVITERSLNGPLGLATWCVFPDSSEIYSFQIAFEKGVRWYTGTKQPKPGTWDLSSAALHELGHVGGRSDHYRDASPECEKPPGEVMCPAIAEGQQRHLGKHDKQTFEAAY